MPIERGKIREFARATRTKHEAFSGPDAVIPPTFLCHARLAWEPAEESPLRELDIDVTKILHGEEEYVFHGPPPRAGQTLTVTARLGDQWEKEGKRGGVMRFANIVNEFRDGDGALVATQTTTLVQTGKQVSG